MQQSAPAEPPLPLVHTTDAYRFSEALSEDILEATPCRYFNHEPLLYLFYGRPSFRANDKQQPSSLGHYLPVCIIIDDSYGSPPARVFPFDSGAFKDERYNNVMHHDMDILDFGLEPDRQSPARLVTLAFGSVVNYLSGKALADREFDASQFEANSYMALIKGAPANDLDSRGSSIEIQMRNGISIKDHAKAVVLPSTFMVSDMIKELKGRNITIIPYSVVNRLRPSEYFSTIYDHCIGFYRNIGIVGTK